MPVTDTPVFELGPPQRIQQRLALIVAGRPHVRRRALLTILIGWAPLAILALLQGSFPSFISDMGVLARSLVAAPLLVLAEITCAVRLSGIARHFLDADLIASRDLPAFDRAVSSTKALLDALSIEIAVTLLAYALILTAAFIAPPGLLPAWHLSPQGAPGYSLAGWWSVLVSLPLLLTLLLGWIWRWILWARFLWLISQLNLNLVPSHPDHAAGLGFVGHSLRAFGVVALALGAIVAGRIANEVLLGASPLAHKYLLLGAMAAIVGALAAPLLAFSGPLLREWHRGTSSYGELATYLGRRFERKWFDKSAREKAEGLEAGDFSALTDLYQIVSNVYAMRFLPIDVQSLFALIVALLLPFAPVVLMAVPADVILSELGAFLF